MAIRNILKQKEINISEIKEYYLCLIFYCYLSEKITREINAQKRRRRPDFEFLAERDEDWEIWRGEIIQWKGYYVPPQKVFRNVLRSYREEHKQNIDELGTEIGKILRELENNSKRDYLKGIFGEINFRRRDERFGKNDTDRGRKIIRILETVEEFIDSREDKMAAFGEIYGEFIRECLENRGSDFSRNHCTSPGVSELVRKIISAEKHKYESIYDPCCDSGSLFRDFLKEEELKFFGQSKGEDSLNLCKIGFLMNDIDMSRINIREGNILRDNKFRWSEGTGEKFEFDVVVSKPSVEVITSWRSEWDQDKYMVGGILPPNSKGDWAMVGLCMNFLNERGVAAVFCTKDSLCRTHKMEREIRKYLVQNNHIRSIILLPKKVFYSDDREWCLLIFKREKTEGKILFVDASELFRRGKNRNILDRESIKTIMESYKRNETTENLSRLVEKSEIVGKSYDLAVESYVEKEEKMEEIDVEELHRRIKRNEDELKSLWEERDICLRNLCPKGGGWIPN